MSRWKEDPFIHTEATDVFFAGKSLKRISESLSTPIYVYSRARIKENINRLKTALASSVRPFRIRYALKANRFPEILELFLNEGDIGIDACSPDEVDYAIKQGFLPDQISVTASNLSNHDLARLANAGVHINSDTESVFRRYAGIAKPGATVGIRLDPPVPLHRDNGEKLNYIGGKFGAGPADFDRVLQRVLSDGLNLTTMHVHCGWSMQQTHLDAFEAAIQLLANRIKNQPSVKVANVGGGLSHKHTPEENPITPEQWAAILKKHLGDLDVTIECEIGTFLLANAGLLLMEVNTVEERNGRKWLGVNSGHPVNVYPYHYGIPLEIIPVSNPQAQATERYEIGSNINEAMDFVARDVYLPEINEGDILAMYATGAYGSSMSSNHCLRGNYAERMI